MTGLLLFSGEIALHAMDLRTDMAKKRTFWMRSLSFTEPRARPIRTLSSCMSASSYSCNTFTVYTDEDQFTVYSDNSKTVKNNKRRISTNWMNNDLYKWIWILLASHILIFHALWMIFFKQVCIDDFSKTLQFLSKYVEPHFIILF